MWNKFPRSFTEAFVLFHDHVSAKIALDDVKYADLPLDKEKYGNIVSFKSSLRASTGDKRRCGTFLFLWSESEKVPHIRVVLPLSQNI